VSGATGTNGDTLKWHNVTRDKLCPICTKADWCSVSEDGVWAACRRTNNGAGTEKTDRSGATYHLHRLDGGTVSSGDGRWRPPSLSLADGRGDLADPDTRNRVYSTLIGHLSIKGHAVHQLQARGLQREGVATARLARELGYRSLGAGRAAATYKLVEAGMEADLTRTPGFFVREKDDGSRYWTLTGAGGLLIPIRDHQKRIVALLLRPDEQRSGSKYLFLSSRRHGGAGPGSPIHVPLFDKATDVVRVTEGALKADLATFFSGVLTIGLPGVNSWLRAAAVLRQLGARVVRVAFDADVTFNRNVAQCLHRLWGSLREQGFSVEVETWQLKDGKGIDDLLANCKKPDVLAGEAAEAAVEGWLRASAEAEAALDAEAAKRQAAPPSPHVGTAANGRPPGPTQGGANGQQQNLPTITGNKKQLRDVTAQALAAIKAKNNPPTVYQRGGVLARLRLQPDTGAVSLEPLVDAALRGVLARAANWRKIRDTKQGEVWEEDAPPLEVVKDLANLPGWDGIPVIRSVTECPIFSEAGDLIELPGFHPAARIYYRPAPGLVVPAVSAKPGRDDVDAARALLLVDLYGDFPFKDDASKAHALAALLLPFVRMLIDGPTPLHLLDAPTEGTGKTLLANCIAVVATGRAAEATGEGNCNEEWRKRLTAALLEAPPIILLDNLNEVLDSGALAAVLTTRVWKDRILGQSKTAVVPNTALWLGSGNNTRLSREMIRRTVWSRLDAGTETPWERAKFRHPNLLRWATENRGRLVWAALTLVQAWLAAGRPAGRRTLGMFDSWAEVVGGILDVAGVPGLLENMDQFRKERADVAGEWRAFVAAWWNKHQGQAVGVKDLFELAIEQQLLDSVLGDKGERSQRTRLGNALVRMTDRVVAGYKISRLSGEDHKGRQRYQLTETAEASDAAKTDTVAEATQPPGDREERVCEWEV
jgi:hypothetical protein